MNRLRHKKIYVPLLSFLLTFSASLSAYAYDEDKIAKEGLVRGDLSTWTQRGDSFIENKKISVNDSTPLSSMGCSYYATFFMLCKMGLKDPLKDTAWEFAQECYQKGLCQKGTGYFDPRSLSKLTDGRAVYVEKGNFSDYYLGQKAIARCDTEAKQLALLKKYTEEKGYFCVVCVVGTATNYQGLEYDSDGHYFFVDSVSDNDMVIGDPAFPGTKWSDNWGAHGASIVKVYCYKLTDSSGKQVMPSERQSMYIIRSPYDD